MKTILFCALFLHLALAVNADGFQLADMVGQWGANTRESRSGQALSYKSRVSIVLRKDGTVVMTEKSKNPVFGHVIQKNTYCSNGDAGGVVTARGLVLTKASGKWKKRGNEIIVSGRVAGVTGSGKFRGTLTLISKRTMRYVGVSRGTRIVSTSRRL